MRLKVQLFDNWKWRQDVPGPTAFERQGSTSAFQVSWAEYRGDKPYRPLDEEGMRQFAVKFGREFGELVKSSSGTCSFGIYGTAIFRSASHPRSQVWILTNSRDHILATHICSVAPSAQEVAEVQVIARSLALGPEQPPNTAPEPTATAP
jgi:hypothetical protein